MTWIIACSGPGAMAVIERNEAFGWRMFTIAALVAFAAAITAILRRRHTAYLWLAIGFTVIHPAVWMGARRGDCGNMLYLASIVATVLVGGFGVTAALITARSPRERGSDGSAS